MLNFGFKRKHNGIPRDGLLLYLGRPNLEAADVPLGDDTEIGDDTIIRWKFLLPADADIRAATGWISGTGNIFYDAVGDPISVFASEIAAWASINQWNVLFHLVSADTETGRLAIYAQETPLAILNKALKVLREDQIDLTPTAFFNGVFTPAQITAEGGTYTGGPTVFADNLGALQTAPSGMPALQGMRFTGGAYYDTTITGTPLLPSVQQPTRTFDVGFTTSAPGPTYKKYARTNPAVDLPGYLCEPARTNKCTCRKANPVDLSGLTKSGDAAAVLSVVNKQPELLVSKLDKICTLGNVYKFDTTGAVVDSYVRCVGSAGNTNKHSYSGYFIKSGGDAFLTDISSSATDTPIPSSSTFTYVKRDNWTGTATADWTIRVKPNTVVYFVLPQLEEGAFATSPICKLADGSEPLTAITRQGTVLSFPTSGKIRNNDVALKLSAVPRGAGQSGYLWGSYTNASNFTYLSINPYGITFKSVVNGLSQDLAIADYTHKADTPFEVILCKSTKGSQLLVREYSAGVWQPWVRGGFSVASDNLVVGSTYTLGAFNNAGQFAGNISELDSLLIPAGIANPVAWVESQWGVNDAVSNPVIFNHTFTGLTLLDGVLSTKSASDSVTINWGDGTSNTYSGTADTAFTHTYASATTVYNVTYTASDNSVLTKMSYTSRAGGQVGGLLSLPAGMTYFDCSGSNTLSGVLSLPAAMTFFSCAGSNTFSGVLSLPAAMTLFSCSGSNTLSGVLSLPAAMTFFSCAGSNTFSGVLSLPAGMAGFYCTGYNTLSGALSLPAGMTVFFCYGFNTLSGALSLPAGMANFTCTGSNTLSGALSLPAGMTNFVCYGSNTLSGALSLPAGMTHFSCSGSNTLSGVLSLPAGMANFVCYGSNTLSGALSLPAGMTYFTCTGFNTLSGALSLPAGMTYFTCTGSNTLSGYTPSTKASNQQRFMLTGLNTLSAANVDAIINDYAAAGGTWTGEKTFSMTVLTASNRTAASDAAWATLGTKGLVTRTITLR